jgi:hypothetical protein
MNENENEWMIMNKNESKFLNLSANQWINQCLPERFTSANGNKWTNEW